MQKGIKITIEPGEESVDQVLAALETCGALVKLSGWERQDTDYVCSGGRHYGKTVVSLVLKARG